MNRLSSCLIILAICSAVYSNKCMAMNPFIQQLAESSSIIVDIYDTPRKDIVIKHCQLEWQAHGTCCDQDDLVMFNQLENKLIDLNVEFLANIVKKKAQKIVGVLNKQGGNFHKFAKVHAKHILEEFIQAPEVVHFKENTKKCWDFMKRQRSSALCSTCSGRSSIFFDHGKILVSPDTCAEAITNCSSFFQSIRIIVKLFNQVNPILLNHNEDHNYIEINFFLKMLEASGPPDHLIKGFADYTAATLNNSTTSNLARQAESTTCSMILNIMKTPYVMAINPRNVAQVGKALVA